MYGGQFLSGMIFSLYLDAAFIKNDLSSWSTPSCKIDSATTKYPTTLLIFLQSPSGDFGWKKNKYR